MDQVTGQNTWGTSWTIMLIKIATAKPTAPANIPTAIKQKQKLPMAIAYFTVAFLPTIYSTTRYSYIASCKFTTQPIWCMRLMDVSIF